MKNRFLKEVIFRSAYLVLAVIALLSSMGFWSIWTGSGSGTFNVWFFTNYFDWTIIMSIFATAFALAEDFKIYKNGDLNVYTKKFTFLKFCTFSGMIFGILLGATIVDRVGDLRLTDSTAYGSIYPAIATKAYWLDFSLLSTMLLCPALYIVQYILFEEKGTTREVYATLGIVPPTLFYLFDKIFGIIFSAVYGGTDAVIAANKYAVAFPFFFYDDLTYHQWWWALLWPTIFGVALVTINRSAYIISHLKRKENGKLYFDKTQPKEEDCTDMFHPLAVKKAAKKAAKQAAKENKNTKE